MKKLHDLLIQAFPAALTALLWAAVAPAHAGVVEVEVTPNPCVVECEDKPIGSLKIENYRKVENFLDDEGNLRSGAYLEAIFTKFTSINNLRWVQAITAGTNTIGPPPYLDPFNRDDGLPFYWTEPENAAAGTGDGGVRFSDLPSQVVAAPANSITFEAGLFCVDFETMEMTFLKGFTWGYTRDDTDGDGQRDDVTLNPFAWMNAASMTMKDLVAAWDGSNMAPFAGDGTPDGWKVVDDCQNCLPEPGSLLLLLAGSGWFLIASRRRSPLRQVA